MSKKKSPAKTNREDFPAADYDAIEAAVMETARGRWFLKEFAQRNRVANTEQVLDAISGLAAQITTREADPEAAVFDPSPMTSRLDDIAEQLSMLATAPIVPIESAAPDIAEAESTVEEIAPISAGAATPEADTEDPSFTLSTPPSDDADVFDASSEFDAAAFLFDGTDEGTTLALDGQPQETGSASVTEPDAEQDPDRSPQDTAESDEDIVFTGSDTLYVGATAQPATNIADAAYMIDDLEFAGPSPTAEHGDEPPADDDGEFDEDTADTEFEALDLKQAEVDATTLRPEPGHAAVILTPADNTSDEADVFSENVEALSDHTAASPQSGGRRVAGGGAQVDAIAESEPDSDAAQDPTADLTDAEKQALFS